MSFPTNNVAQYKFQNNNCIVTFLDKHKMRLLKSCIRLFSTQKLYSEFTVNLHLRTVQYTVQSSGDDLSYR